jgi:hypothetical protein
VPELQHQSCHLRALGRLALERRRPGSRPATGLAARRRRCVWQSALHHGAGHHGGPAAAAAKVRLRHEARRDAAAVQRQQRRLALLLQRRVQPAAVRLLLQHRLRLVARPLLLRVLPGAKGQATLPADRAIRPKLPAAAQLQACGRVSWETGGPGAVRHAEPVRHEVGRQLAPLHAAPRPHVLLLLLLLHVLLHQAWQHCHCLRSAAAGGGTQRLSGASGRELRLLGQLLLQTGLLLQEGPGVGGSGPQTGVRELLHVELAGGQA